MTTDVAYDHDGITLLHGDCRLLMPAITTTVDLVVADLPYATTRQHWDRMIDPKALWYSYRSLCGPRSPVVLFGTGMFGAQMMMSNPAWFKYDLIWSKEAVSGHLNAKRQPLRAHESLLVFYDKQPTYNPQMVDTGRRSHSRGKRVERTVNHYGQHDNTPVPEDQQGQYPRSILTFKRPKVRGGHPNQKPVELVQWVIETYTNPGDLVLDNTCGSATTLVAARNTGRRAIGIESHEPFIDMAVARLESGAEGDQW